MFPCEMARYIAGFPAEARKYGLLPPETLAIDGIKPRRHDPVMNFKILDEIADIETFAEGSGIREIGRLRRIYGRGRWRKRKGIARVRLADGTIHFG
jgi:hypothetical protein